jgi:hypothetical protein
MATMLSVTAALAVVLAPVERACGQAAAPVPQVQVNCRCYERNLVSGQRDVISQPSLVLVADGQPGNYFVGQTLTLANAKGQAESVDIGFRLRFACSGLADCKCRITGEVEYSLFPAGATTIAEVRRSGSPFSKSVLLGQTNRVEFKTETGKVYQFEFEAVEIN